MRRLTHLELLLYSVNMKKLFILLCTSIYTLASSAQDAWFTQFQYAPVYLNPAFAGTGKSNLRLSGVTKMQWFNLNQPFKYVAAAADMSVYDETQRNIANWGLAVSHSQKGYISNTYVSGIVGRSFGTSNQDCSDWFLNLSLQAGFNFSRVNPKHFVFIDQLNQTGITGNASTIDLFNTFPSKSYFDMAAGGVFTWRDWLIGAAVHHLNEPNTSFVGKPDDARLPRKMTGQIGYIHETESIRLKPMVIAQFQQQSSALTAGAMVEFLDFPIEFGLWYRNNVGFSNVNAFGLSFNWRFGDWKSPTSTRREYAGRMGVSYDAELTRPGIRSTHGSLEFGVQKDIILKDNMYCPTSTSGICTYRYPWEFF